MPERREGPTRNKQTGYYFFDEYVGIGQDKKRIRFSLKIRDPEKAQWRWEQHYSIIEESQQWIRTTDFF